MLRVEGEVVSGSGEGRKYVSMPVYNEVLSRILKSKPFEGTLNISLRGLSVDELAANCTPNTVSDINVGGVTYGGFYYWLCRIVNSRNNMSDDAVALRPFRSRNPKNVVELISDKCLRERMMLEDGDLVTLEFMC